jgi:hypothetical protein
LPQLDLCLLAAAADRGPVDFPDLLLTPGVGARTVQSLAMVAEVVHGTPYRFQDPARFSLAHGGKDRHPYPVPIKVYDETIRVLKSAVSSAKLGHGEQMQALKRLDEQARVLERVASGPSFEAFVARETNRSASLNGRSIFGWEEDVAKTHKVSRLTIRFSEYMPSQPYLVTLPQSLAGCGFAKNISTRSPTSTLPTAYTKPTTPLRPIACRTNVEAPPS